MVEIPHIDWTNPSVGMHGSDLSIPDYPAWEQPITPEGILCRPIVRCNCGKWCGIGAHHVHADGVITESFFHAHSDTGLKWSSPDGCGWHVWIKLKDYSGGDFLPDVS